MLLARTFFAILTLCVIAASAYKEELRKTMQGCKNGQEVTDAELEEFLKPLIPTTTDEKCLMACVFKAFNVIINGTYDPRLALAVSQDLMKDDPEKVKKIKDIIEHCGDDVPKKMDNECDLAGEIMQCVVKYEKAMGLA
ncbi:general odorant-binding protein 28a-like [Cimex lectularius]|uniref:Odorant binding protein n=1 Tax=Cimex lectularius TaxID=79782 RepID=A0A8I6RS52_CIMLE|nr:general odorant-binding protein 28a-like [Cimex lectularius]